MHLKEERVKRKYQPEWFNDEIKSAIKNRDSAKNTEPEVYRFWRNKLSNLPYTISKEKLL